MIKLPVVLALISTAAVGGLTLTNVLDTFVTEHASGTTESLSEDFDFDDSTSEADDDSSESSSSSTGGGSLGSSSSETYINYTAGTRKIGKKSVPYYLVDIHLKKISDLRTQIATNSSGQYGSNITQSFSDLVEDAEEKSGTTVLAAISGDYAFWSGRAGYVVRNGAAYRDSNRSTDGEDFAIFKDGSVLAYDENNVAFDDLMDMNNGCYQNWCFGPALLMDGTISVEEDEEIDGRSMSNNERTAIGYAGDNHFYFLTTEVNGSRNSSSASSFSLYDLASFFQELGCEYAYNLDGGGSVAMYADGEYPIEANRNLGDIIYVVNS